MKTTNPYIIPGIKPAPKVLSMMDRVTEFVSYRYGISTEQCRSYSRKGEIALARKICMYILWKCTRSTQECIGEYYGKDHSTVNHAVKTVSGYLETDKNLVDEIDEVKDFFELKILDNKK